MPWIGWAEDLTGRMAATNPDTNYLCWFAATNAPHYFTQNANGQDRQSCTPEKGFTTLPNLLYASSGLIDFS
jgi:hypothetical protein